MTNEIRNISIEEINNYDCHDYILGIGSEGCVHSFYTKIDKFIGNKDKVDRRYSFRIITPRVPLKHMDRVLDKIKEFIKVFNVESIVVNDYGLLYRISKTEGLISEIILGRTLIRTIEDTPWYRLIVESEQEEVKNSIIKPNILHLQKLELFNIYNIKGVELSPVKGNIEALKKLKMYGIKAFIHYKNELATIGRTCPLMRALEKDTYECKKDCNNIVNIQFKKGYGIMDEKKIQDEEVVPDFWGIENAFYHKFNIDEKFDYDKCDGVIYNYLLDAELNE